MIQIVPNVFQFTVLISIGILAYIVFMRVQEVITSRKLVMKNYMSYLNKSPTAKTYSNNSFLSKYHQDIQKMFDEAGINKSPVSFTVRRIIMAIVFPVFVLVLYAITGMKMYLFFIPFLAYIAFQIPKSSLNKMINAKKQKFKQELPDYLSSFAILLQSYTPYEATKKSIDYAGVMLRPHVERLITEIDLNPSSGQPYLDFAKVINIPEAKEFMVALNQSSTVNAIHARKIIEDQIKLSDELQEEGYNELIENRPKEIQKWERSQVMAMMAIILVFTFLQIYKAFSNI